MYLWDTVTNEKYSSPGADPHAQVWRESNVLRAHQLNTACFIFAYSIDSKKSFNDLKEYHIFSKKLLLNNAQLPAIIVGLKLDKESSRQVSQAEGKELAASLNCFWMEICTIEDKGVREVFNIACRIAFTTYKQSQEPTNTNSKNCNIS